VSDQTNSLTKLANDDLLLLHSAHDNMVTWLRYMVMKAIGK